MHEDLILEQENNPEIWRWLKGRINGDGLHYTMKYYSKWEDIEDTEFHLYRKLFLYFSDKLEEYINKKVIEEIDDEHTRL